MRPLVLIGICLTLGSLASANVDSPVSISDSKTLESVSIPLTTGSLSSSPASSSSSAPSSSSGASAVGSTGPESRQILAGNTHGLSGVSSGASSLSGASFGTNFPFSAYNSAPFVSNLNGNPASLGGSLSALNGPTSNNVGSGNSLLNMLRPQQHGGRRSSLTNRLKNFMTSFFWNKENGNSNPYLASGSSYSFAYKQPPFGFQSGSSAFVPSSNGGGSSASLGSFGNFASASAYRPVVFPAYPGSSSGNNGGLASLSDSLTASGSGSPNFKSQFGSSSGFNQPLAPSTSYWTGNGNNNNQNLNMNNNNGGGSLGASGSFAVNPNSPSSFGSSYTNNNGMYSGFQAAASSHSNVYSQPAPNSMNSNLNNNNNGNSLNGNMNSAGLNLAGSPSSAPSSLHNPDNNGNGNNNIHNPYQRSGSGPSNFKPVSSAAIFSASSPIGSLISGPLSSALSSAPVSPSVFASSAQTSSAPSSSSSGLVSANKPSPTY